MTQKKVQPSDLIQLATGKRSVQPFLESTEHTLAYKYIYDRLIPPLAPNSSTRFSRVCATLALCSSIASSCSSSFSLSPLLSAAECLWIPGTATYRPQIQHKLASVYDIQSRLLVAVTGPPKRQVIRTILRGPSLTFVYYIHDSVAVVFESLFCFELLPCLEPFDQTSTTF